MPTRYIDRSVLQRAFDALVPPGALPKELLRWKELARQVGLGEHWMRKRYQGLVQSELDLRSIELIRKALERKARATKDTALGPLIDQLSGTGVRPGGRASAAGSGGAGGMRRMRVVNVAFIRASSARYVLRLEAGIRSGIVNAMQGSHLVDDEALDLSAITTQAGQRTAMGGLLGRFNIDPSYVDRTYLVTLGTPATRALASLLAHNRRFRNRLGKDFRVIFASVTDLAHTGILEFDRDYVAGMYYGSSVTERVRFIAEAFPGKPIAFLHDPRLAPDRYVLQEVLEHPELGVLPVEVEKRDSTRVPARVKGHLVMGYYYVDIHIHQLVRDNPEMAFVGVNTTDLGRGAVLSTGNDGFLAGVECAQRLIAPECRNEINLRDTEVLRPPAVYGVNLKACNAHGLVPSIGAQNRCRVVVD